MARYNASMYSRGTLVAYLESEHDEKFGDFYERCKKVSREYNSDSATILDTVLDVEYPYPHRL